MVGTCKACIIMSSQVAHHVGTDLQFQHPNATRYTSTCTFKFPSTPRQDASPLQGYLYSLVLNSLDRYPGGERYCESNYMYLTQEHNTYIQPGLQPRPLNLDESTLTNIPLGLSLTYQQLQLLLYKCNKFMITLRGPYNCSRHRTLLAQLTDAF